MTKARHDTCSVRARSRVQTMNGATPQATEAQDEAATSCPVLAPPATQVRGHCVLSSRPLLALEFDGLGEIRYLNAPARQMFGSASHEETVRCLRTALALSREQRGSGASVTLETNTGPRELLVDVSESMETNRYVLVLTEQEGFPQNRLTRETAAAIAHHIRNPLAGIRGAVEVIGARLPSGNADLKAVIRQIVERVDALDDSLDALLGHLRPEPPRLRPVQLRSVLERVLAPEACPKSLRALAIRLSCVDITLHVDPQQLTQALFDLLDNAAEALPEGAGTVEVNVTRTPPYATISVVNAGTPIAAELLPYVCNAFFTTKARALGLGLTNARAIARAHGGDLVVSSCRSGTEVRLQLPL